MADWAETLSNNALTTLALCSGSNAPLAIEAKVSSARTITELMAGEYATYKKVKERTKIGKSVSKAFREKHGTAPLTTRLASGHEANINVYAETDWGWIKARIQEAKTADEDRQDDCASVQGEARDGT